MMPCWTRRRSHRNFNLSVVNNAVFASGTVDIDPAGAVNAMLVSVDAGIAIHIIRRSPIAIFALNVFF